jgi:type IV pilus assembly protein PilO
MKLGLREIIFFKLMLGLLLASYFFGIKRMEAKRQGFEQEIAAKQARLTELARASRDIDDVVGKLASLEEGIHFFEKKLPEEQAVDSILNSVTQLVEKHQLKCRTFKPSPKTQAGTNFREKQIEMTLSGDFFGFYAFLRELERVPRIIKLTDMKLTKIDESDEQTKAGQMQAVMKLSVFFDPATPAVADAR